MPGIMKMQISQRGVLVLPKSLRESYNLQVGDSLTLLDLGGVFVLTPQQSKIDPIAEQLAQALSEQGETLETMLHALREERERYAGRS